MYFTMFFIYYDNTIKIKNRRKTNKQKIFGGLE